MNKVSAQQIRSLELRIARLEKEAGLLSDIGSLLSAPFKITNNLLGKITNAFADVGSQVGNELFSTVSRANHELLGGALSVRVYDSLSPIFGITTSSIPYMVDGGYNIKNPIKSLFTGGKAGTRKMPLDELASLYEGEEQKRIKKAYISWKSDYSESIKDSQGIVKKEKGIITKYISGFLKFLQRSSKLLYRLVKGLLTFVSLAELIMAPWAYLFFLVGCSLVSTFRLASAVTSNFSGGFTWHLKNAPANAIDLSGVDKFSLSSGAGSLSFTFITMAVKLLEKAFYRYGVNVDAFDAESAGKTASSYPRVASVVRLLESHA